MQLYYSILIFISPNYYVIQIKYFNYNNNGRSNTVFIYLFLNNNR